MDAFFHGKSHLEMDEMGAGGDVDPICPLYLIIVDSIYKKYPLSTKQLIHYI